MDIPKKILIPFSHLPTLFLLIGYPIFWLELYFFRGHGGHTSFLAWSFMLVATMAFAIGRQSYFKDSFLTFRHWSGSARLSVKLFFILAAIFTFAILIIVLYAALLPPHLAQEFDAINYHITLPRQHLLAGSFRHLPWSVADLLLLPVDFALAPYWLATTVPNKFPQFIFFWVCWRLSQD